MPNASASDDITVDGIAKSRVPRRSFCSISRSPPSWLEPNTITFALPPSFSLARRANSLADRSKSEPGPPTWPSLSSVWAAACRLAPRSSVAMSRRRRGFIRVSGFRRLEFACRSGGGEHLRGRRVSGEEIHRRLDAAAGEATPASLRPISTPASAAMRVRSLQSPRWPMRNIRPLTLPRPVPSERSKRSWISLRRASASTPGGRDHAGQHRRMRARVGALDRQAPGADRAAHRLAPALVAREHRRQALARASCRAPPRAVEQVGVRRVGPVAALVHLDDLVPGPEGLGQRRRLARLDRLRRRAR